MTKLDPRTLLLIAACLPTALAQQNEKTAPVSFEAVSIQPSDSEERCAPYASVGQTFTVKNCALGALITYAYDVLQEQVSGETFLLNEKYDVTAKAEVPVSRNRMKRMLQTLLEDRFKLSLRQETKEMPVYALVVGKDGPKFKQSQLPPDEGPKPVQGEAGQVTFKNTAMSDIVFGLSRRISDRMIIDKTGLSGRYDVDMTWYLALGKANPPSVFDAVQRIGLKLEPQNSPVEFLIIDRIVRPAEK